MIRFRRDPSGAGDHGRKGIVVKRYVVRLSGDLKRWFSNLPHSGVLTRIVFILGRFCRLDLGRPE
jgi:hypothetical protein